MSLHLRGDRYERALSVWMAAGARVDARRGPGVGPARGPSASGVARRSPVVAHEDVALSRRPVDTVRSRSSWNQRSATGRHPSPRLRYSRARLLPWGGAAASSRDLRRLAAGYGIGTTTVFRYITEAIELLAARAPTLLKVMAVVVAKTFVILDGTLSRIGMGSGRDRPD